MQFKDLRPDWGTNINSACIPACSAGDVVILGRQQRWRLELSKWENGLINSLSHRPSSHMTS